MSTPPPRPPLFPYTTLFRSRRPRGVQQFPARRRRQQRRLRQSVCRAAAGRQHRGIQGRREQRSEEHTSELQSLRHLVCRLLLEKKNEYGLIESVTQL